MGQVIEMCRARRGEEDLCRMVLILDDEWVNGESGQMHKCGNRDGHTGFHQCYCGTVYRDDGSTWVPSMLPGITGGTWRQL